MGRSIGSLTGALALAAGANAAAHLKRRDEVALATTTYHFPLDQVYPLPTQGPSDEVLRRRQAASGTTAYMAPDATCGYVNGRAGSPYECIDNNYNCIFFTANQDLDGWVACCNSVTCGARATCYDLEQVSSSALCDDECKLDAFTLKCTDSAFPYCNTVSFSSNIYDYWCNNIDISTIQAAETTYSGQESTPSWSPIPLDATESELPDLPSSGETDGKTEPPASGPTGDNSPNNSDNDGEGGNSNNDGNRDNDNNNDNGGGGGSQTNVGAIAGGVVGGVAVLAAIGFGIWFMLRRKSDKKSQSNNNTAAAPTDAHQPPPMYQTSPGQAGGMQGPPGAMGPPPSGMQSQHSSMYDPKFGYVQTTQQTTPSPMQGQQELYTPGSGQSPQQQPQPPPAAAGGFYPSGVSMPDRNSSASPGVVSDSNMSSHRNSTVGPVSPGGFVSNTQSPQSPQQQYGPGAPQGQPPATIYEASGAAEGHHRGQMHELP